MFINNRIDSNNSARGAVFPLVALAVVVIVILIAFVIEYGYLIIVKNESQAAVDAAALSAVAGIPAYNRAGNSTNSQTLSEYFNQTYSGAGNGGGVTVESNDVMHTSSSITFNSDVTFIQRQSPGNFTVNPPFADANGVKVTRTYQVPPLFGGLLGSQPRPVTVEAHAYLTGPRCFPVNSPIVLLSPSCGSSNPPASNCTSSQCNTDYTVAFTSPSPTDNAGFWAIAGSAASAQECIDLVSGAIPSRYVCVGDQINLNNGVVGSCMHEMRRQCVRRLCDQDVQWKVTVPFISCADLQDANGNFVGNAPIRGFATIGITRVVDTGNPKSIRMRIMCGDSATGAPGGGGFCGFYSAPFLE